MMVQPMLLPMIRLRLALAICAVPLVLPMALGAQRNNSSDVTGLGITSSSPAGGVYVPALQRVSVPVADGGNVSAPTSARLEQAVVTLQERLSAGALRSLGGATISADQQRTLRAIFTTESRGQALDVLRANLAPMLDVANAPLLNALMTALGDMGTFPTPRNVALAVDRFNAMVDASKPEALAAPGPTLVALHAALTQLARGTSVSPP
jgi:hypothetical protein